MWLINMIEKIKDSFHTWRISHRKVTRKTLDERRRKEIADELDKLIGYNRKGNRVS